MSESQDHLGGFVPSPCLGICTMEGEYCAGCYRTLNEIAMWGTLENDQKRELIKVLDERKALDREGNLRKIE